MTFYILFFIGIWVFSLSYSRSWKDDIKFFVYAFLFGAYGVYTVLFASEFTLVAMNIDVMSTIQFYGTVIGMFILLLFETDEVKRKQHNESVFEYGERLVLDTFSKKNIMLGLTFTIAYSVAFSTATASIKSNMQEERIVKLEKKVEKLQTLLEK